MCDYITQHAFCYCVAKCTLLCEWIDWWTCNKSKKQKSLKLIRHLQCDSETNCALNEKVILSWNVVSSYHSRLLFVIAHQKLQFSCFVYAKVGYLCSRIMMDKYTKELLSIYIYSKFQWHFLFKHITAISPWCFHLFVCLKGSNANPSARVIHMIKQERKVMIGLLFANIFFFLSVDLAIKVNTIWVWHRKNYK